MPLAFNAPGPVAAQFMSATGIVQILTGPLGGGKSTCALFKLLAIALAQPVVNNRRRARHIILRNTGGQLRDTIKPLVDQWFVEAPEQALGTWNLTDLKFYLKMQLADETILDMELWCMAADTPEDVRRLLSTECTAAWVEEGREVNSEVFAGLQGRVGRYPSVMNGGVAYPCTLVTTNMPVVGSYWHDVMVNEPEGWDIFHQPAAVLEDLTLNPVRENPYLPDGYYENQISGKSEEWINVYLKCRFGTDVAGLPVYRSSFNRSMHIARAHYDPLRTPAYPIVVGMDNGLTAAAVLIQPNVRGKLIVLDECFVPLGQTMGVERFLDNLLIPLLRRQYYGCRFIFRLDPACFDRQQYDEVTIAQGVQSKDHEFVVLKSPTNDPEKRISAVEQALVRQIDGEGYLQINPQCKHLINAMEWGYKYAARRDGSPNTNNDPVKDIYSHVSDACQYGVLHFISPPVEQRRSARVIKPSGYVWS